MRFAPLLVALTFAASCGSGDRPTLSAPPQVVAPTTTEIELAPIDPMVDVTFLLLIFFMITASFSIQKSLEVPPPEPEEKGQSTAIQNLEEFEEESIMVEIDARNLVMVDEQIVSDLNQLPKVLKSARKPEILIMAHEDCLHEVVVRVIDASNEIGLQKIRVGLKKGN